MDFRWVAGIALWTMLSGPVFVRLQTAPPMPARAVVSAPTTSVVPVSYTPMK